MKSMIHILVLTSLIAGPSVSLASAPQCAAIFTDASETPFDFREMHDQVYSLERLNRKQRALERLTRKTSGRATDLERQQTIKQLRFNIEQGKGRKVLQDIQTVSVELGVSFFRFKTTEVRFTALRAKANLTEREALELSALTRTRARSLREIGRDFTSHRAAVAELYKYQSQPEYKDAATDILKYLGVTDSWLKQNPALATYAARLAPDASRPYAWLRPSIDELQQLFIGRAAGLTDDERLIGLMTKLDQDLLAQRIDNTLRALSGTLGDQAFLNFTQSLFKRISFLKAADAETRERLAKKTGQAMSDLNAIGHHYEAIEHLLESRVPTSEKFKALLEYCGRFGSNEEGVPLFMITFARRASDTLPLWLELKEYVETSQPKFKLGKDLTFGGAMEKAEEARQLGLLPSVGDPRGTARYKMARSVVTAVLAVAIAKFLYNYVTGDSDEKKEGEKAKGTRWDELEGFLKSLAQDESLHKIIFGTEPAKESAAPGKPAEN